MKKILFTIIIFLLLPIITYASDISYDITNYYINADILANGDLEVTEVIVMDGTFNGYIRDILYKNSNLNSDTYENNTIYNASGLNILSVSAKSVSNVSFDIINDTDFTALTSNQASNLGYVESNITNGKSYKMYYRSNGGKVAFKIKYLLKDVVVLHDDVAELYYTFIGDEYDDEINDLKIKVNLPGIDNSDNFRVWAHGDLAGEINMYNNSYALATVSSLDAYSSVDIRLTFSPNLVNDSVSKVMDDVALDDILEVEQQRADEANNLRSVMKKKYYFCVISSVVYLVSLLIAWIYIYIKYDREYKNTFTNEYNREFIDDYNVEVVDYLFHKNNITANAMSASIMNLIYKKNIRVEEIPSEKKKKEYTFYLENEDNINDTEKCLIDFLFNKVGSENKFSSKDLQQYAKSTKTCEDFSNSYRTWKNKVISDGKKQEFYEDKSKPKLVGTIFFFVALALIFINAYFNVENILIYLAVFFSIIFLVYTLTFTKRSIKGSEHYYKWKAFKKFLKDFGRFDFKNLPEVSLWERYMVYATLFGLAKEVSKAMNVQLKELENNGLYTGNYYPTFTDWYVYNSINDIFVNSVHENISTITSERANSVSSSGSGFGGGFSSGGGFGGGGGGGHGF